MMVIAALLATTPVLGETFGFQFQPSTGALIGAPIMLNGLATYPDRYALSPQTDGQNTDPFTVLKVELGDAKADHGVKTQPVRLTVVPFQTGTLTLPSLNWKLESGASTETLKSPPVKIEASAPQAKPGDTEDIRDISPPIGPSWWPLWLALLTGTILGWGGWRAYRRRRTQADTGPAPEPIDARPPDIRALEALERLRYDAMSPKEYYDQLSDIVRLYFERRFEIPALTLTTTDLLRQMRQAEIDRNLIGNSKSLFDRCDLVKFAKLTPDADSALRDREAAAALIRAAAPPPPQLSTPAIHK